jgi:hypothetical protein
MGFEVEKTNTGIAPAQKKEAQEVTDPLAAGLEEELDNIISGESAIDEQLGIEIFGEAEQQFGPLSEEGIPLLVDQIQDFETEQTDIKLTDPQAPDPAFGKIMLLDMGNNHLAAKQGHHPFIERLQKAPDNVNTSARVDLPPDRIRNPDTEKYVAFYDNDGQLSLYLRDPELDDIMMPHRIAYLFGDASITEAIRFSGKAVSTATASAVAKAEAQMTDAGKAANAARLERTRDVIDPASYRSALDRNIARRVRDLTKQFIKVSDDVRPQAVEQGLRSYIKQADVRQILTNNEIETIVNNARAVAREGRVTILPKSSADEIIKVLENSADASNRSATEVIKEQVKKLPLLFWDRSSGVKREIARKLGTASGSPGERTLTSFLNVWGAPASARVKFFDARKPVFRGVPSKERPLLDQVIMLRRLQTITSYRDTHKVGGVIYNIETTQAALDKLRQTHGADVILQMEKRADSYFNAIKDQVTSLWQAGLVSDDELVRLTRLDYTPLELIDAVDPVIDLTVGGRAGKITVKSSGIQALGRGGRELIETDSELLLNQFMMRTESRIARNTANRALYKAGLADPTNGFVFIKKPKNTKTSEMSVMIGGERKKFYIPTEFADEWFAGSGRLMNRGLMEALSWASLAKIVKPLATGSNAVFALRNFPRELHGAWMKTDEYSAFWPVAKAQQWNDVTEVFRDVMKPDYGKITRQFFQEGGATQFLAQQGHIHTFTESQLFRPMLKHPVVQRSLFAAEYVSERAELLVRVSAFNRALKNGKRPDEAARIAREIIDFDQGGVLTKTIDAFFPYLNASVQGIRSMFRASGVGELGGAILRKGPTKEAAKRLQTFGLKITQYTSMVYAWNIMNRQINEEGWRQIPDDVKTNNLILMTPFSYQDENGEKRYMYMRIPTEQTMRPFIAFANGMGDWYFDGKEPSDVYRNTMAGIKEAMSIVPGADSIPLFSAISTYGTNRDSWNNVPVWRGPEVLPEAEIVERPGRRTPQMAQDVSGIVSPVARSLSQDPNIDVIGMSPERTTAAARKVFPSNPILDIPTSIYEHIRKPGDLPDSLEAQPLQRLKDVPLIGNSIGFTNPIAPFMDKTTYYRRIGNTRRFELATELDNIIDSGKILQKDTFDDAKAYARSLGDNKIWALNRLSARRVLDKIVDRVDFSTPGVPPKTWWLNIRDIQPKERAILVGDAYANADPSAKRVIQRLTRLVPGLHDSNGLFAHHWAVEKKRATQRQ